MKYIEIRNVEDLVSLAGYDYGLEIYRTQVEPYDAMEDLTIIIPENIIYVTSSFYQGLFAEIVGKCRKPLNEHIMIDAKSNSPFIKTRFNQVINELINGK